MFALLNYLKVVVPKGPFWRKKNWNNPKWNFCNQEKTNRISKLFIIQFKIQKKISKKNDYYIYLNPFVKMSEFENFKSFPWGDSPYIGIIFFWVKNCPKKSNFVAHRKKTNDMDKMNYELAGVLAGKQHNIMVVFFIRS